MKNHDLGNFISEQRIRRGLSQYQLGMLVGVSGKAVSKWENGSSHPRLSVCEKLTDVLGISLDELLSCRYLPAQSPDGNTGIFAKQKSIWKNVYERLLSVYGCNVPPEILSRYNSEKAAMQGSDLIVYFDFLSKLVQKAQEKNYPVTFRAETCSSYIAWLMGITNCNPARPHYYCPKCKKTEFHMDVKDGWDLPDKKCTCGQLMHRDGHNILWEQFYSSMRRSICFDINFPDAFLQEAQEFVINYFKQDRKLLLWKVPLHGGGIGGYRYVMIQKDSQECDPDKIAEITHDEYIEKYYSCSAAITLNNSSLNTVLHKLCQKTNRTVGKVDFLDPCVIEAYRTANIHPSLNYSRKPLAPFLQQLQPERFSSITQAYALLHGTGVWEGNALELLQSGTANAEELISCREDVFDMIYGKMLQKGITDVGFATDVMNSVYKGLFKRKGIKPEIRNALQNIDIPEWYIQSMQKIDYLFPKSHIISYLINDMQLIWFSINEKALFDNVVSEFME